MRGALSVASAGVTSAWVADDDVATYSQAAHGTYAVIGCGFPVAFPQKPY